jgi:hypothetical protein
LDDFVKIEDYPNYMISPKGQVYNSKLKTLMNASDEGYERLSLRNENGRFKINVHRLVAKTFIPNPDDLPVVNHIDGNKTNNDVSNLEWVSSQQNSQHAINTGLTKAPNEAAVLQYTLNEEFLCEYKSLAEASRQTTINRRAIGKNCTGFTKTSGGFIWKYKNPDKVLNTNPTITVLKGNQIREVDQIDLETDSVIKTWENIIVASETLNIRRQYIFRVCAGNTRSVTAGGFGWRYAH